MSKGTLFLIPSFLGNNDYDYCFPSANKKIVSQIRHFIVEDIRTARRFLKPGGYLQNFEDVSFYVLNKHTSTAELSSFIKTAEAGINMGLLSEAGCPCIADPGAHIVELAHEKNIKVVPLVGPSSIILSLMASGFNGQNFIFHGYLPIKQNERIAAIKSLESNIYKNNQTQIFIETPYRNQALFKDILETTQQNTKLCVAVNITMEDEHIRTLTISQWKKNIPDLNKKPTVFLLYK